MMSEYFAQVKAFSEDKIYIFIFWIWNKCFHSLIGKLFHLMMNSFLASCDFCRLLITFANGLNQDQNVGPDLDSNHLALW